MRGEATCLSCHKVYHHTSRHRSCGDSKCYWWAKNHPTERRPDIFGRTCPTCEAIFYPALLNTKYCSPACKNRGCRSGKSAPCDHCGRSFISYSGARYCGRDCTNEGRKRSTIERWRISAAGRICTVCQTYKAADQYTIKRRLCGSLEHTCKSCIRKRRWPDGKSCQRCGGEVPPRCGKYCSISCREAALAERDRETYLQRTYGVSKQWYDDTFAKQQGRCAICRSEVSGLLHVDHCHKTGAIRGLLCFRCNVALGYLGDDIDRVLSAGVYLEASQAVAA